MTNKQVNNIYRDTGRHWVGDGFPVSSMFSYYDNGADISPFLLLDYAGPARFEPADHQRGVEFHPHRGFETVTIVYEGEVEHKDNVGNSGKIGPGDVQWMTAAKGILHEEMHSKEFAKSGGNFEMIQLWVNLPAKDKMVDPAYQTILNKDIPVVDLPNDAGIARIIAGEYGDAEGAAVTFTPIDLWDMRLKAGKEVDITLPKGRNAMLLVLSGRVTIKGEATVTSREIAQFSNEGEVISLDIKEDTTALLLSGEPIDEPIVGRGPFVMNTDEEIRAAFNDYRAGKF